ncbi:MAG: flagellar export chaperone FlgN [Bdellovibrionota bacterium]
MDELISLLDQFNAILKQQIEALNEFVIVLDQEENAIRLYQFLEIEKSVILKDQHTQIAAALEEKRIQLLKRICYMIAFDSRGQTLSLPLFKTVFSSYLENVKTILPKNIVEKLYELNTSFIEISNEFSDTFQQASKRIYRNQLILKKVIRHVNLSINLFQTAAEASTNYDALGKTQSVFSQQNAVSSIRVTV